MSRRTKIFAVILFVLAAITVIAMNTSWFTLFLPPLVVNVGLPTLVFLVAMVVIGMLHRDRPRQSSDNF